jgi:hypothetical protein
MICKKCGREISDDAIFCQYCGEVACTSGYPENRKVSDGNEIFSTVYYGPDYYKGKDESEGHNGNEKKRGLKKIAEYLSHKKNKS